MGVGSFLLTLTSVGGMVHSPLRFFEDTEKTAARSAYGFSASLWGILCATFGKKN